MRFQKTNHQDARLSAHISCPCRHLESGRTPIPKLCIYNYKCWKCAFDQWLDELDAQQEILIAAA